MLSLTTDYDSEVLTDLTVRRLLRNRSEQIGDEQAVVYGPERTTYTFTELYETGNRIGNSLLDLDIDPQEKVSVMAKGPLESLLALVGSNAAGMVYSPINFEYKGDALSYQLNDTDPAVLIVEDRYAGRINEIVDDLERVPHVVRIETDEGGPAFDERVSVTPFEELSAGRSDEPDVAVSPHDDASIIYTSGTTGLPKGVVIPHRWIFANYTLFRQQLLNGDDVVHTSLPMYHVGGVYFDVHSAWVSGASAVLWDRFSPNEFWDRIEAFGATTVTLVSVMATWLEKQAATDAPTPLNKVHMQPLPEEYDAMADRFGLDFVTVGFGQTESGLPLASAIRAARGDQATPPDVRKGKSPDAIVDDLERIGVPVVEDAPGERYMGKPLSSIVEATTLDDNDERTPPNVAGELAFRPKLSSIVLKEYYGKPERTVEAFSNLWFHTGDAAVTDEAGNYYYVDREGDVIRRRGENISSLQVQEIVNAHDRVEKTAAFPVPAREGGEDEVAIAVEPVASDVLDEDDLREFLADRMPAFMRPKYVDIVADIPTTKTNKLEKYKLRQRVVEREGLE